jgi:hypothetical protein
MSDAEINLEILFSRLLNPSGMVRERACVWIAESMASSSSKESIRARLLDWISEQHLESTSIFGLLILQRLKNDHGLDALPSGEEVDRSVRAPSVLSWMLLKELFGEAVEELDWKTAYSGSCPSSFKPDPFFEEHVENFLPLVYWDNAEYISHHCEVDFVRQWAWEWTNLIRATDIAESTEVLYEWGRRDDKHYFVFDSLMSEVYRSSFLRTLAWTVDSEILTIEEAGGYAVQACPVDLGLWEVDVGQEPSWVPRIEPPKGAIDITHSQILAEVERLWENKVTSEGMVLLEASLPIVREANIGIDLSIWGVLQASSGHKRPALPDVINWCKKQYRGRSALRPLSFGAKFEPASSTGFEEALGDWVLLPTAIRVYPITAPRWQYWRIYDGLWFPSPFLFSKEVLITPAERTMEIRMENELVGYWSDWVVGLREMQVPNLPPSSGQALWLSTSLVEKAEKKEGLSFCWICEVRTYHRKYSHEKFEEVSTEQQFGASFLVKP